MFSSFSVIHSTAISLSFWLALTLKANGNGRTINLASNTSLNLFGAADAASVFTVNTDAESAATDRFRLVFEAKVIILPLPFTFKNLRANLQNNDIAVEWITENEENIESYDVEISANGQQFEKAAAVMAKGSNSIENYQWLDANAEPGMHYYRIRSLNENDEVLYSNIVKVEVNPKKSEIAVYPNPVVNGRINIKLINQAKGNYVLTLIDNFGHPVITKQIYISDSNVTETITVGQNFVKGTHHLEILSPDNIITSINVILQ